MLFKNLWHNSVQTNLIFYGFRAVLMYFALSGLDILNQLNSIPEQRKRYFINWIYSLQVVNEKGEACILLILLIWRFYFSELVSGFQGSTTLITKENRGHNAPYKWAHIANTYACLSSLIILGDDLSRVNRRAILNSMYSGRWSLIFLLIYSFHLMCFNLACF